MAVPGRARRSRTRDKFVDVDSTGAFERDVLELSLSTVDIGVGIDLVALDDVVGGNFVAGLGIDLGVLMRWPVCLLIWLKLTFSVSEVAGKKRHWASHSDSFRKALPICPRRHSSTPLHQPPTPTTQANSGCFNAANACGPKHEADEGDRCPDREGHGGELKRRNFPVATVRTDSSDHIRIAVSPIIVAVRGVMGPTWRLRHGRGLSRPSMSSLGCKGGCPAQGLGMTTYERGAGSTGRSNHTMYCPPLIVSVEPVMAPASSAARNTTARAISSGSPRRLTGISGRMLFSSTSFGTACTISVLM